MWEMRQGAIIAAHWSAFPGVTAQYCCCSRTFKDRRDRLFPKVTVERSQKLTSCPAYRQGRERWLSGRGRCILCPLRTAVMGLMCSLYWQRRPSAAHSNQSLLPVAQSQRVLSLNNSRKCSSLQRLQNRAATYHWSWHLVLVIKHYVFGCFAVPQTRLKQRENYISFYSRTDNI